MVKKSRGWLRVAWCRLIVPLTFGSVTALKESWVRFPKVESLTTIAAWMTPLMGRSVCEMADVTDEEDVISHLMTWVETPAVCKSESISLEPALAVPERER